MKFKRTMRAGIRDQRGDTLVEIAISAVVVLTLLFAIMEFGRAMYIYHFVSYAAQAGTRYAIVRGNSWKTACSSSTTGMDCTAAATDITAYVQSIAPSGVSTSSPPLTVTPSWPGTTPNSGGTITCTAGTPSPGCVVQVVVSYQFSFIAPFMPGSPLTFSATSQQVIQK